MSVAIAWFKVASDIFANRKIRKAGPIGALVFFFVLAKNAARDALGWIPAADLEPWFVADTLRLSEEDASKGISGALAAGLIAFDGDRVSICGWDDHWAKRQLSEAERKRVQRARSKNGTVQDDGTDVRDGGTEVTDDEAGPDCPTGEERRGEKRRQEETRGSSGRRRGSPSA